MAVAEAPRPSGAGRDPRRPSRFRPQIDSTGRGGSVGERRRGLALVGAGIAQVAIATVMAVTVAPAPATAQLAPRPTRGQPATVTAAPARPRVVLFGDSMLAESSAAVKRSLRTLKPTWDVEVRAFPGTGICNWLDEMRGTNADAVALVFTGVLMTDCILNVRQWPDAYLSDARTAAAIFRAKGTEVIWLDWPRPAGNILSPHADNTIWGYYLEVAHEYGDQVADPGASLYDPAAGDFPMTLPCLTPSEPGCTHGRVPVRDLRGGHLCPVTDQEGACPVYSSGVRRFGLAVASDVAAALPRVPA
jgi:hypothetical protein